MQILRHAFLSFIIAYSAVGRAETQQDLETSIAEERWVFDKCLEGIGREEQDYTDRLNQIYTAVDGSIAKIAKSNETIFYKGELGRGAVLIMHGIMSSPAALKKLIDEFKASHITILAPLIFGFGSTVKVANLSSVEEWQSAMNFHYATLSRCFKSIALMGFSLGGGLATDFVLNRYPRYLEQGYGKINSLLLLSPAIRPSEKFGRVKAAFTLPFTDAVPFWLISKLKNDPDIDQMMKEPEVYNQYFPVHVGLSLIDLADILKKNVSPGFHSTSYL